MFLLLLMCWCVGVKSVPLPVHIVDMTHNVNPDSHKYPPFREFELKIIHNGTYSSPEFWLQTGEYTSSTHLGTHMDAPSHFVKGGLAIDHIPIESFIAPAAVIDVVEKSELDHDYGVSIDDLQDWESTTHQSLNGTILLLRTGWSYFYTNRTAYLGTSTNDITQLHFPGVEPEAAQWLVDHRSVLGIGTDALSFDKGNSQDLMSHQILLGKGLFGLENVANVDKIPIYGATLHVMPMKIGKASGAPTRIVATFPKVVFARHAAH